MAKIHGLSFEFPARIMVKINSLSTPFCGSIFSTLIALTKGKQKLPIILLSNPPDVRLYDWAITPSPLNSVAERSESPKGERRVYTAMHDVSFLHATAISSIGRVDVVMVNCERF